MVAWDRAWFVPTGRLVLQTALPEALCPVMFLPVCIRVVLPQARLPAGFLRV